MKKRKRKNNLGIIIFSILGGLVIIFIFGYSYWQHKEELKLEREQGVQGEVTKAGKEEVEKDLTGGNGEKMNEETKNKTANWRIYKNTNYGYSVKYPQDWYEGPSNREDSWLVYFTNNKVDKISDIDLVEGIKVEILVQSNPRNLSLDDWAQEGHLFDSSPKSSKKIKVAGYDAIKEEVISEEEGMSMRIYFFKDNNVYTISYSGPEADYNKYKGEFNDMVGGFEFE